MKKNITSKNIFTFSAWVIILAVECTLRVYNFHGLAASLSVAAIGLFIFFVPENKRAVQVFSIFLIGLSLSGIFLEKYKIEVSNYDNDLKILTSQKETVPMSQLEKCNIYEGKFANFLKRECALRNENVKNKQDIERKRITQKNLDIENRINSLSKGISFIDFFSNPKIYAHLLWSFLLPLIQVNLVPKTKIEKNFEIEKLVKPRLASESKYKLVLKVLKEKDKNPKATLYKICMDNGINYKSFDRWKKEMSKKDKSFVRKGLEGEQENDEGITV